MSYRPDQYKGGVRLPRSCDKSHGNNYFRKVALDV